MRFRQVNLISRISAPFFLHSSSVEHILKVADNPHDFVKIRYCAKKHLTLHGLVILSPCGDLIISWDKAKRTSLDSIVIHPVLVEKNGTMFGHTGKQFQVLYCSIGNTLDRKFVYLENKGKCASTRYG